jgi:hypothetical protein
MKREIAHVVLLTVPFIVCVLVFYLVWVGLGSLFVCLLLFGIEILNCVLGKMSTNVAFYEIIWFACLFGAAVIQLAKKKSS